MSQFSRSVALETETVFFPSEYLPEGQKPRRRAHAWFQTFHPLRISPIDLILCEPIAPLA
jgi:hypothetical protein